MQKGKRNFYHNPIVLQFEEILIFLLLTVVLHLTYLSNSILKENQGSQTRLINFSKETLLVIFQGKLFEAILKTQQFEWTRRQKIALAEGLDQSTFSP